MALDMRSFPAPALTVRQSILKVSGVEGRKVLC
jgi:hypothetical protein